jgi:O-antigen/teichoic acid export membrane protein
VSTALTFRRAGLLAAVGSSQAVVQAVGFLAALLLLHHMAPAEFGRYTLAMSLLGTANVLADLGLSTAVMAAGGRLAAGRQAAAAALIDAVALHRRIAGVALLLGLPAGVALLQGLGGTPASTLMIVGLVGLTSWCNVRSLLALSVLRVNAEVAYPQQVELAANGLRLLLFAGAALVFYDAVLAMAMVLAASALQWALLWWRARPAAPSTACTERRRELIDHVRRQAPNAVWFVVSSQIAVWLVSIFGNAERVAEVGALGRLAALFAIIGAVSAALVQPYFARQHDESALRAAFGWVNVFFCCVLGALLAIAHGAPQAMLWLLGPSYAALQAELVWLVVAATFSAWGGTLFSVAAARGWVLPVAWAIAGGTLAIAATASAVDVSTVRGAFMINSAAAIVGTAVSFVFVGARLRHHRRLQEQQA